MSLISNPEFSLINGQAHHSKTQVDVVNPATGEHLAQVSEADNQAADKALQAAAETFEKLASTTAHARSQVLRKWYELVIEHRQTLAEIVTKEQGKPLKEHLPRRIMLQDLLNGIAKKPSAPMVRLFPVILNHMS